MLNWFYDQSLEGGIELKATCAPHYFRVARQRKAAERERRAACRIAPAVETTGILHRSHRNDHAGIDWDSLEAECGMASPVGHPGGHPSDLNAMTKGCLAGTGVCFISHEGEVYPCGYLPVVAGDLRKQSFPGYLGELDVFHELRDDSGLKGKCGCCEFRNVCMGCRATRVRGERRFHGIRAILRLSAAHGEFEEGRNRTCSSCEISCFPTPALKPGFTMLL